MSSNNASQKVVSVDEQALEQAESDASAEPLQATVDQETQAKVDANHPEGIADTSEDRIHGVTLEQEERIKAREAELERISAQADLGGQDGRAKRTREVAAAQSAERRTEFQERAASVNARADPDRPDPRTELTQAELGAVNEQAMRVAAELDGWTRAAVSRRLAEAVLDGADIASAVLDVKDDLEIAPGQVIPIGRIGDVDRQKVSIEGTVTELWDASNPAIEQVGLIEDESGRTKFTSWVKSMPKIVAEGDRVRIRGAARNWYQGRVSVAVTGWTTMSFPERGRWWDE